MWAKRLIIGSSLTVASLAMVPALAGAASGCPPTNSQTMIGSVTGPSGSGGTSCVVVPATASASTGPAPVSVIPSDATPATAATTTSAGTTSLPFTGADFEELAVVGAGAVLVGGLLIRRRRRPIA
jgi:hypothetical protein